MGLRLSLADAKRMGIMPRVKAALPRIAKAPPQISDILVQPFVRDVTLTEEQRLSADLYRALLNERRLGRLFAIFSCVPAELPIPTWTDELKKVASTIQRKRQAMGVIAGVPDWFFCWQGGGGVIELKVPERTENMKVVQLVKGPALRVVKRPAGRLNDSQVAFRLWCVEMKVPHAVAHSVDEALRILREWGAVGDGPMQRSETRDPSPTAL